jgi:hypothetical protein
VQVQTFRFTQLLGQVSHSKNLIPLKGNGEDGWSFETSCTREQHFRIISRKIINLRRWNFKNDLTSHQPRLFKKLCVKGYFEHFFRIVSCFGCPHGAGLGAHQE